METVEIIAYFAVTVIIGGLVIAFIAGINPEDIFQSLKKIMFPQEEIKYEKIGSEELALKAYTLWNKCGLGMKEMSMALYVESGPEINKDLLFKTYKKMNFCQSIQSKNQSCGSREDIIIIDDFITPPAVVKVSCNTADRMLVIE